MGEVTGISWTDHTFNPWWGCTNVSPGCDNCYAEALDNRYGFDNWGKGKPRREFGDKHWNEPLQWNRQAEKDRRKHLVFCASMADVMDDEAPEGARERLWKLIDATPNLIWQLLTKRPHRYALHLPNFFHRNVWLGTTAENQEFYDVRWPILQCAAVAMDLLPWISYEPALGPLDMFGGDDKKFCPKWIICGGESGAGHREFKQEWAEDLLKQCRISGTKFFMKQMGGITAVKGKNAIPDKLLIQEFPNYC